MAEKAPYVPRRSSMFFQSDKLGAAEAAAFALEEHGLTFEQATALSEHISNAIDEWWSANVAR